MADDETRARAVVIVMQVFGAAHREEEWAHDSAEAVVADLDDAGLLAAPADQGHDKPAGRAESSQVSNLAGGAR